MSAGLLQRNVPLDELNSFGLPARANWFAVIDAAKRLIELMSRPEWASLPHFILGGGSNLVLTGDFAGLVLQVRIAGRELIAENTDAWFVRAGAGEKWHDFVCWTLKQGWPGLENLALIPGTVGAAPVQNIGAYGLEVAERFHRLEAVDLETGEEVLLDRADCQFGYRDSVFKREAAGRYLITAVTFRLPKRWQPVTGYADLTQELEARQIVSPTARQIADAVIAIRLRKLPDPAQIGNAGSFFKNPRVEAATFASLANRYPNLPHYSQPDGTFKLAAGWLIEHCGWKGRPLGPVSVYEHQALVLVNHGGAAGADVLRLARAIQASVQAEFGIQLEPEPVVL
ncbi:MAG: UDP-N-acetylmuramate dehydrogenase [Candidatus Competibacteraceae bacterium]|nr:UDP-N-acetylmuramate dehydrogenase [Candidatus Competibacteraceae bacterium]MCP5126351.1 UDP-N-acetylmuramate dehydrogenase [Gammaproteobacteria bacterium]HRX70410.1 UDP-N-acetylmuramate dehydrogenase [Candidatus Competibacteraceae bacterium]